MTGSMMAESAQTKDEALGAALIANDKWLVTKLVSAALWGEGTGAELLDGSAWQRCTQRLAALAERICAAHTPDHPIDRADGFRYVCTLLRNAFDVTLEDIDPDRPMFQWLTRRNKIGWDCPDALYANVAIRDDAAYRISGTRGSVHFLGLQLMAGIRTLHNTHADEWTYASDGSFEIIVSRERQPGNWVPLGDGADSIWMRQFFYDWEHERPAGLWIERIDPSPSRITDGRLDPTTFARQLDAVITHVESNVDLWLLTALALRDRFCNAFPDQSFGGAQMGAQKHQQAGTCYFRCAEEEALLITVSPPTAKYWSIGLCNFWLESLEYAGHQSSLNGYQAVVDDDGVFRAVVSHQDPGIANWLDPVGHYEGSLIYRWNLADANPVPQVTVVQTTRINEYLPTTTVRVTPTERAGAVERRRQGIRRRFARPL